MTEELTPTDCQAIVDLENILCILDLEREKESSVLSNETLAFVEQVLDKKGPIFIEQETDLKAFAISAGETLTQLLANCDFRSFLEIDETDYAGCVNRAMTSSGTKADIEAIMQHANIIVNKFKLSLGEQETKPEDSKKDKKKHHDPQQQ